MTDRVAPRAIFDLDGTLLDLTGIRDWAEGRRDDYDTFHKLAANAPIIPSTVSSLYALWGTGWEITIVTARSVKFYTETCSWLADKNIPFHTIWMRANNDLRSDYEVKDEMILMRLTKDELPYLAFEDNPELVKLWEKYGIPTVQVPGWEGHGHG